jgi:hypothetical protein
LLSLLSLSLLPLPLAGGAAAAVAHEAPAAAAGLSRLVYQWEFLKLIKWLVYNNLDVS